MGEVDEEIDPGAGPRLAGALESAIIPVPDRRSLGPTGTSGSSTPPVPPRLGRWRILRMGGEGFSWEPARQCFSSPHRCVNLTRPEGGPRRGGFTATLMC